MKKTERHRMILLFAVILLLPVFAAPSSASNQYSVPPHHRDIEFIAREIAYLGGTTPGGPGLGGDWRLREVLKGTVYDLEPGAVIDDVDTGLQAMVIKNRETLQNYIVFRGTWITSGEGMADAVADLDPRGDTGDSQYSAHQDKLANWAARYPGAIVTGHSLGAALGQRYISENPDAVKEGVLFNAPGIFTSHADSFARRERQPPVTIYVGRSKVAEDTNWPEYDIASELVGRSHLPARIVEVTFLTPQGSADRIVAVTHSAWMLRSNEKRTVVEIPYEDYQSRRETSWDDSAGWRLTAQRWVPRIVPALEIGLDMMGYDYSDTLAAVNAFVKGFGGTRGPRNPTEQMIRSGRRDCTKAKDFMEKAGKELQGRITAKTLLDSSHSLNRAQEYAVGCPEAVSAIDGLRQAIKMAESRLKLILDEARESCDLEALDDALGLLGVLPDDHTFYQNGIELRKRHTAITKVKDAMEEHKSSFSDAQNSDNLENMRKSLNQYIHVAKNSDPVECYHEDLEWARMARDAYNNAVNRFARLADEEIASAFLAQQACTDTMHEHLDKAQHHLDTIGRPEARGAISRRERLHRIKEFFDIACAQPDKAYVVVTISGSGWVPHWSNGSWGVSGEDDQVLTLQRPESLTARIEDIRKALKNACEAHNPSVSGSNQRPWFWIGDPHAGIKIHPTMDRNVIIREELRGTWEASTDKGKNLQDLKADFCGGQ